MQAWNELQYVNCYRFYSLRFYQQKKGGLVYVEIYSKLAKRPRMKHVKGTNRSTLKVRYCHSESAVA